MRKSLFKKDNRWVEKEKYKNGCKELQKYCKELKEIDDKFKVNDKVKGLCEGKDKKCEELGGKVKAGLGTFKEELEKAFKR
ncbi:hypothetical protein T552_01108 [Pneumocystis carinii B80]|uniref:Major surface glycoprotein n=1 Tax=Pneumocystis carinii (strain B80) TaxID=1408658 RepID=A0A0W4ZNF2_PNEC8|nr:hypothetical protein T552_01108 [Pneumocystis carinii B80]KTW29904.1 hypothetical protein T552_01108 [Pneumocystis carinii B80]